MSLTPFEGLHRKLVVAIDVGTTYSGVSYSILDPGQIPEIRGVNRYPAQEHVGGDLKIPTVLWYDQAGVVQAAGAEATRDGIEVQAEDKQWVKSEWFKVYMRPSATQAPNELHKIPPLPLGKSVVEVFADFLRYIFACTKTYIQETHANGKAIWESFDDEIHFVLTHPNSYEGPQQAMMREAAVLARLVPDNEAAQARVSLVTEGEASLHYCIQSGLTTDAMKEGKGVMIVDAGGGTIDFSSYAQVGDAFQEVAASACIYSGSVFVTSRARIFLEGLLKGTRFEEDINAITERFDKKTKPTFRTSEDDYFIQFTGARENEKALNIRSGQLRIKGSDVASFFDPSVDDIVQSVDEQTLACQTEISSIFLVGGFAASDYLFNNLKERFELYGFELSRPDSHINKAVAHGAISYYLDHRVTTRVSKYTYGIPCDVPFDPSNAEHKKRESSKYQNASNKWYIPGAFDVILPRDTQVAETREFRRSFGRVRKQLSDLHTMETCVAAQLFTELFSNTHFSNIQSSKEMFASMCTIEADLKELCATLKPQRSITDNGAENEYYRIDFEIALLFGLTEFKTLVIWKDDQGQEKRSAAAKVKFAPDDND
ncbi:hypothetical protein NLJ89_g7891 [Agrocybe chaxingu]|uniref:Uncharacterized protein n=1 Tax=Agrocybe chaxingu TaxID=84603 RepID=A0A9W8JWE7_9AGAR|nr:hypothetical protein NLJ89_g7891 [Agrocybe chaxingu]